MTILCGDSDELHFFGVIDDLFRFDERSIAVRIIIIITVVIRFDCDCALSGDLTHNFFELLGTHVTFF